MNVPNMLTMFRLFLIPVFILFFFSHIFNSLLISIFIFLIAGITDVLDGFIARKYNLITKWGVVLDPLADKLMLIAVLTCLVIKGYIPIWVLFIIVAKDFCMIVCGILLYKKNIVIPSNIGGKIATLFFYVAIFVLSFNVSLGKKLLYVAVFSSLFAFINYLVNYLRR